MLSPKNISILKFLLLHKFLLERKHLQFFAKLFAVLIAALSRFQQILANFIALSRHLHVLCADFPVKIKTFELDCDPLCVSGAGGPRASGQPDQAGVHLSAPQPRGHQEELQRVRHTQVSQPEVSFSIYI